MANQVLEKFLQLEFPNDNFTDKNKEFLEKYSLKKEPSPNIILKDINEDIKQEGKYYEKYPCIRIAKERLQNLHTRYSSINKRNKDYIGANLYFEDFLDLWCNSNKKCFYCGVEEKITIPAFEKNDDKEGIFWGKGKKISHKSGVLQVDRINSKKGYFKGNCVFACVLCNNAKCELIDGKEYKQFLGKAMANYWENIKSKPNI